MPESLRRLPAFLKDILLEFAFARDEIRPVEDTIPELLELFVRSTPGVLQAALAAPGVEGWLAFSSNGESYLGPTRCPETFGQPPELDRLDRQTLRPDGWLAVWGHRSEADLHLGVWSRVAEQVLDRHRYQELHHGYRALVDTAVDAIIVIDARGTIRQFNPGAERMFGYRAEEVIGGTVNRLMPPPHAQDHDGYLDHYLRTGEKRIIGIGRRVPGRRQDGSIFPAHLAVSEFMRGGERFFIGTLRDLSDFVEARSRASVEERRHLSRELHDSVSQALFGIVLGAQAVKNALAKPERAVEAVDYVLQLAESALAEMRTLIFELRPEALESEGLLVCLGKQTAALAKRYGIVVELRSDGGEPLLDLPVKHEVYRIIMESLHNVVKHARAGRCEVELTPLPGEYRVRIGDDGQGFDVGQVSPQKMGLHSMRERVAQLGGRIRIGSAPGEGCVIEANFPAHYS